MAKAIQLTELSLDYVYQERKLTAEDLNLILGLVQPGTSYFFICDFVDERSMPWVLLDADTFYSVFEFVGPQFLTKFQRVRRKD